MKPEPNHWMHWMQKEKKSLYEIWVKFVTLEGITGKKKPKWRQVLYRIRFMSFLPHDASEHNSHRSSDKLLLHFLSSVCTLAWRHATLAIQLWLLFGHCFFLFFHTPKLTKLFLHIVSEILVTLRCHVH